MNTIELIYDHDCPNVELARKHLIRAFTETGVSARWVEWDRGDESSPPHVRNFGSPTILVNGKDVADIDPADDISCCRVYTDETPGFKGAPPVSVIAAALRNLPATSSATDNRDGQSGWRSSLAVVPGIGAALLPVGICPACWPAYAGLLSAVGFGFLMKTAYLLPLTALFLVFAVAALAFKAKTRRGYKPFLLGLLASAIVLFGKFGFASNLAMYGGIAVLMAASFWNAWPRMITETNGETCPACAPTGQVSQSV